MIPQGTEPDLPVSVQESPAACHGVRALNTTVLGAVECWHKSFSGTLPLPLLSFSLRPNYREGTHPHPSTETWIKNLLSKFKNIWSNRQIWPWSTK